MGINSSTGMVNLATGDIGTTYTITYTTPAGPCSNSSTTTITIDPLDDPYFTYSDVDFCNYGTAPIITVSTPGGVFTVSPAGLSVNAATGLIDLSTVLREHIILLPILLLRDCAVIHLPS